MHFQESKSKAPFFIKAYEPGQLFVNNLTLEAPVIIFQDQLKTDVLPKQLEDLALEHVKVILDLEPELILIGTGVHQKFLDHALLEPLTEKQIGIEMMNTLSAARTFNLLREEGRRVLGAFFL